jgi:MSHA biogenesis protein MshO
MNMRPAMVLLKQRGFTLIEAILVIVITGIVVGMVALFIRLPAQNYVDAVARATLTDVADTALQRMKRDIRLALPNSVRTTLDADNRVYLEFLQTKTGGRYLAAEDGIGGDILNWDDATDRTFSFVGTVPIGNQAIAAHDYLVVYNLGVALEPANAYDCSGPCNRALIASIDTANKVVTLTSNPFFFQNPAMTSPSNRFQVVSSAVTYVCDKTAHTLRRYWNYQIKPDQPATLALLAVRDPNKPPLDPGNPDADSALLAGNVKDCMFTVDALANVQAALVTLDIAFEVVNSNSGTIKLVQQVNVNNKP